jgi:hypothetical protein
MDETMGKQLRDGRRDEAPHSPQYQGPVERADFRPAHTRWVMPSRLRGVSRYAAAGTPRTKPSGSLPSCLRSSASHTRACSSRG